MIMNKVMKEICKGCKYTRDISSDPCALYVEGFLNYRRKKCEHKEVEEQDET